MEGGAEPLRHHLRGQDACPLVTITYTKLWTRSSRRLRLTAKFVREHLPPPRLRMLKWLMAPQK
jgi:hypothetical protein